MNVSDYFRSKLYHLKCPALMSTCRYQSQLGDWHWQKCPHGWCIELMWPEAHPIWPLMTLQTHWDDQASNPFHYMGWASIHAVSLPQALCSSDALQTFKWHQKQSEHIGTWTKSKREKGHLVTWVMHWLSSIALLHGLKLKWSWMTFDNEAFDWVKKQNVWCGLTFK